MDNRKSWIVLIEIFSVLAIVGIVLTIFEWKYNLIYLCFITPVYTIAIYRPLYLIFKRIMKREPKDTFMNWSSGLFYDRVFNIIFLMLSVIPIFLVISLYAIINNG